MDRQSMALLIPILALSIPVVAVVMNGIHKMMKLRIEEARVRSGLVDGVEVGEVEALRADLAAANSKATEVERRAGELRADLERANQAAVEQQKAAQALAGQLDQVRGELAKVQAKADAADQAHQEQRKQIAAEAHRQAERLTATQAERDAARKEASQAREEAATLRGRLEALETIMAQDKAKAGNAKKT